jgi:hypothetical protein
MTGRWVFPIDPECPEVAEYMERLFSDPMTSYSGCGDEIAEAFERKHRMGCKRCQEYGAANVDVAY